jgi:hypothetical protein
MNWASGTGSGYDVRAKKEIPEKWLKKYFKAT